MSNPTISRLWEGTFYLTIIIIFIPLVQFRQGLAANVGIPAVMRQAGLIICM